MSNREAKQQARQWVEEPVCLAEDLRHMLSWVEESLLAPSDRAAPEKTSGDIRMLLSDRRRVAEGLERLTVLDRALWEYRRMLPETLVKFEMWQALMETLRAEPTVEERSFDGWLALEQAVVAVEEWARRQSWKSTQPPARSEVLKAVIEELGDELLVRTDKDGSLKLRGSVNIPMFLAFWRAPKHRLSREMFLDIDPGSNLTYLERHRTRLCAKLQDVLIEVVTEGNGFRMQKCRK